MEKKRTKKDLETAIEKMAIGGNNNFSDCFHNFLDLALSYFCNNMDERQMALRKRVEENEDFRKAYQEALEAYGDCAENYKDPLGYEVTEVKIDTVTTNYKCARYVHDWTDSLTVDNIASQLMFAVLPEKTQKRMERYAELPMFDTLQPDVAYISAKATVRHTIDKDGNKSVCSVYVFMRNGDVVTVEHSDSKTKFQSVLDKWQPKEIQNVIGALSEMAETWSFLN